MKIYLATDHAGFALKEKISFFIKNLGYEAVDCGATSFVSGDDYTVYISKLAQIIAQDQTGTKGIIFGASGQGEAMMANRFKGVRAMVYYGQTIVKGGFLNLFTKKDKSSDIIRLGREHNNANVLSIGASFVGEDEAKKVVKQWLCTPFGEEERHTRRNCQLDSIN